MDRRFFLAAGSGTVLSACLPNGGSVSQGNVRILDQREAGPQRPYGYRRITDPTGTARSALVERFELRGGDCHRGDCRPRELNGRTVTRGRVEKMYGLDVGEGDDLIYSFSLYFPSEEYTWVPGVGATYGQLLYRPVRRSDEQSRPMWSLDTERDPTSRRFYSAMVEAEDSEGNTASKQYREATQGNYGSTAMPSDQWIDFKVFARLSSDPSLGFIRATRNGVSAGQLNGRTMRSGGGVEIRYGIYQTGTNQYADLFGGTVRNIPTQVVYYSGISFQKAQFV